MLSRLIAGIHRSSNTIVINFPGSSKAVIECFGVVLPVLKHLVDQTKGTKQTKHYHEKNESKIPESVVAKTGSHHGCNCFTETTSETNPNESPYRMTPFNEARNLSKTSLSKIGTVEKSFPKLNSTLLEAVFSSCNIPAHPTSIKDGYAIISKDSRGHGTPKIVADNVIAGTSSEGIAQVFPGCAIKIATGAVLPTGADAVVMVEHVKNLTEDGVAKIQILESGFPIKSRQDIREIGNDIKIGEKLADAGMIVTKELLALFHQARITDVKQKLQPLYGVMSSGNELISADEIEENQHKLECGWCVDCNRPYLLSYLPKNTMDLGIVTDEYGLIKSKFLDSFDVGVEVLITSGGVSMGDKDIIKTVLNEFCETYNGQILFGRVNIKPGKPMTLAEFEYAGKKRLVFALPGNPISAMVCFHVFVKNILEQKQKVMVEFDSEVVLDVRPELHRCYYDERTGKIKTTGSQMSSKISSLAWCNALAIFPGKTGDKTRLLKGDEVEMIQF